MKKLLLVPLVLILFATPMAVDLLVEGFEGGVCPPSGWDIWEEGSYNYNWGIDTSYPHSGTYYAYRFDYAGLDSWLVTPTLDTSGYENLSFSCWYEECQAAPYMGIYLMGTDVASPDPGDFIELLDMGAPPGSWEERVADASAFDGQPNVTFAVRVTYGDVCCTHFDDFLVTADVTGIESASLGEIKAIYK